MNDRRNAARDLLADNLAARPQQVAIVDAAGTHTYQQVATRAAQFAHLLLASKVQPEQRVLLVMHDSAELVACFLGSIAAGAIPIPLSTLLTASDYAFIAADSRARVLVSSPPLDSVLSAAAQRVPLTWRADAQFDALLEQQPATLHYADTCADDPAFWLYTSGTTGRPKAAIHAQTDLAATATTYADNVLGLGPDDVVFSAAKLFFAYGLGNSLTFPFAAGARVVLLAGPPTAEAVKQVLDSHQPTVFFGVPTLYAMLLNSRNLPAAGHHLRLAVSAGEALPEALLERWRQATGVDIIDGIGSTEMLHIYMSNRVGQVVPGSSGTPVPGYAVRLLDEQRQPVADGDIGDLFVSGPSMALGYWNRRAVTQATFEGAWLRTGDKYRKGAEGAYVYCGRADDLLKVGGIYVSPMEVENVLLGHPAVAEVAVVGQADADELVKPKAFVVPAAGQAADQALRELLISHVRAELAAYKRPRWIEFVDSLPKTATGKIQRFRLREST